MRKTRNLLLGVLGAVALSIPATAYDSRTAAANPASTTSTTVTTSVPQTADQPGPGGYYRWGWFYRQGYRDGFRAGWNQARRDCSWGGPMYRRYSANRAYEQGFERGFQRGFRLGYFEYCR